MEMTAYGKHAWEVFPTFLGKPLARDGVSHITTSTTTIAKGASRIYNKKYF